VNTAIEDPWTIIYISLAPVGNTDERIRNETIGQIARITT
jgi:hypothetical protein